MGNIGDGVRLAGGAAHTVVGGADNQVSGTCKLSCDVIVDNHAHGVEVTDATTTANTVEGDFVGLSDPANAAGNRLRGITVEGSPHNLIGGITTTPGLCSTACNAISHNDQGQVLVTGAGAAGNLLQGNFVGVGNRGNAVEDGPAAAGPGVDGEGAPGNTVGGASAPGGPP